ncbi:MAG TPA: cytochrome c [Pedobacter sp.]
MISKLKIVSLGLALTYLLIAGCTKKQAEEMAPLPPPVPGAQVTYTAVIGPLFQSKCASCHATGQPQASIFNLNGYSSVVANADRIKQQVLVLKAMPLGGSLTAAELRSVQDFFDQGMPQ